MELYFHNNTSPKKRRAFSVPFVRKRSTTIHPEQGLIQKRKFSIVTASSSVTDFFQRKLSTSFPVAAKKLKSQILPFTSHKYRHQECSSLPNDNKHNVCKSVNDLEIPCHPFSPPSRRSKILPLQHQGDNELINRSLPSLPSAESILITRNDKKEDKKTTLGITDTNNTTKSSLRKWLVTQKERKKDMLTIEQEDDDEYPFFEREKKVLNRTFSPRRIVSTMRSRKMTLHCKVLQITNLSSDKSCQYNLQINVTNNQAQTYTGTMTRIAQKMSAAYPETASLSFRVKGQFQFNCDLLLKPYTTTLTSCLKSFVDYNNNTEHTTTVLSNDKTTWKRGRLVLHSGENPSATFANRGVVRHYSMQVSPSERVELAMAIWIEEEKCNSNALLPPDQDVLRYCQMGDYLTFYQAQDENDHKWKRCWVTYRLNHLLLKNSETGGDILDKISLENITQVDVLPSDERCPRKNYGIDLVINEESNIRLFCDSYKSLCYWKCLLEKHVNI